MIEIDVAITVSQLQALIKETLCGRPPDPSCLNTKRYKPDVMRRHSRSALNRLIPRVPLLRLDAHFEKRLARQASGRPHETRLATLDVSWWTKPATAASPHLDSVKVDILQHLIEPRNVDRRQLVPALPLRTCRI